MYCDPCRCILCHPVLCKKVFVFANLKLQRVSALQKLLAMLGDMARGDPEQATRIAVHWISFLIFQDLFVLFIDSFRKWWSPNSKLKALKAIAVEEYWNISETVATNEQQRTPTAYRTVAPGLSSVNFRNNLDIPGRSFSCSVGRVWSAVGRGDPCEDRKGIAFWNMGQHGNMARFW